MTTNLKKFEQQAISAKKQTTIKGGNDNTNIVPPNQETDYIGTIDVVDG